MVTDMGGGEIVGGVGWGKGGVCLEGHMPKPPSQQYIRESLAF